MVTTCSMQKRLVWLATKGISAINLKAVLTLMSFSAREEASHKSLKKCMKLLSNLYPTVFTLRFSVGGTICTTGGSQSATSFELNLLMKKLLLKFYRNLINQIFINLVKLFILSSVLVPLSHFQVSFSIFEVNLFLTRDQQSHPT